MNLNPLIMMREEVDGTGIVFDPENNRAMSLNRTGVTIWKALEDGKDTGEIVSALQSVYNISDDIARRDVLAFLEVLKAKGMLAKD